jgi:two-component system cell cycle response regulator DivK
LHLVLIIEDNEKNLRLAQDLLEYGGFRTLSARTATHGIALAHEHLPDAILMDIQLPDIDGVAALAQLRADEHTRRIPVAAVTAFAMSSDRRRLLEAGFDSYFSKPIDIDRLIDDVRRLCEGANERI